MAVLHAYMKLGLGQHRHQASPYRDRSQLDRRTSLVPIPKWHRHRDALSSAPRCSKNLPMAQGLVSRMNHIQPRNNMRCLKSPSGLTERLTVPFPDSAPSSVLYELAESPAGQVVGCMTQVQRVAGRVAGRTSNLDSSVTPASSPSLFFRPRNSSAWRSHPATRIARFSRVALAESVVGWRNAPGTWSANLHDQWDGGQILGNSQSSSIARR